MTTGPDAAFWQDRWDKGEIGFHRDTPNPALVRHWPSFGLARRTNVLVPLCGKSLDMAWLTGRGHVVTGIELAEKAIRDFLSEHAIDADIEHRDSAAADGTPVPVYTDNERYDLVCADIFDVAPATLQPVDAIYDRASLVALPPDTQPRFAAHLASLVAPATPGLLIALDYDTREMSGPPFSTPPEAVNAAFAPYFDIETLSRENTIDTDPLKNRGLTVLHESVYRLVRKP